MRTVWSQVVCENLIQIIYRHLNKKFFSKDATQKVASVVRCGIAIESVPWRPIFEKCSHLREKGGVLALRTPVGFVLTHRRRVKLGNIRARAIYTGIQIQVRPADAEPRQAARASMVAAESIRASSEVKKRPHLSKMMVSKAGPFCLAQPCGISKANRQLRKTANLDTDYL
jgi:hypothetical protein